jgi:hypothetical protein
VPGLEEQLSLDVSPALAAVQQIDDALQAVVQGFSANLAAALDVLSAPPDTITIPVEADTTAADEAIAATEQVDEAIIPVDADTTAAEGAIDEAEQVDEVIIPVDADTGEARADLDDLGRDITVPVDADVTQAEAELTSFVSDAEGETIEIAVSMDSGSAEADMGALGEQALETGDRMSFMEVAAADLTDQIGGFLPKGAAKGAEAIKSAGVGAIAATGGVLAYGAALGKVVDIGADVISVNQQFEQTFGAAGESLERINVAGLNESLDELAISLGVDDEAMRAVVTSSGALLQTFGASQQEAAAMTEDIVALAAGISSANPALGDMTTIMGTLTTAIATGRTRGLKRLGIEITPEEIEAQAAALGKTTETLTATERQAIFVKLAMEQIGDVSDDVAARQQNAAVILGSLRERFANLIEAVAAPAAVPLLDALGAIGPLLDSLVPIAQRFGDAWAKYIEFTTKLWAVQLQVVGRVIQVAAELAEVVSGVPVIGRIVDENLANDLRGVADAALDASMNMYSAGDSGDTMEAALIDVRTSILDLMDTNTDFRDGLFQSNKSVDELTKLVLGSESAFDSWAGHMRAAGGDSEVLANHLSDMRSAHEAYITDTIAAAVGTDQMTRAQGELIQDMPVLGDQLEALNSVLAINAAEEERAAAATEEAAKQAAIASGGWEQLRLAVLSSSEVDIGAWAEKLKVDGATVQAEVEAIDAAWQSFIDNTLASLPSAGDVMTEFVQKESTAVENLASVRESAWDRIADVRAKVNKAYEDEAAGAEGASERVQAAEEESARVVLEESKKIADAKDQLVLAMDPQTFIDMLAMQTAALRQWQTDIATLQREGFSILAAQALAAGPEVGGAHARMWVEAEPGVRNAAQVTIVDSVKAATTDMLAVLNALPPDVRAKAIASANAGVDGWGTAFDLEPGTALAMDAAGNAVITGTPNAEAELSGGSTAGSFGKGYNPAAAVSNVNAGLATEFRKATGMNLPEVSSQAAEAGKHIGIQFANGVGNGMVNREARRHVEDNAAQLMRFAINAAKTEAGISSPSKEFMKIGAQMAEGMVVGFDQGPTITLPRVGSATTARAASSAGANATTFNVNVNLASGSQIEAQRAGRLLAESAERTLVRRGVIARVRTGG